MAARLKATPEQTRALERAMEARGVRPRDPAHPLRERPSDALRDALANGLGIDATKEAAELLARSCGCSDRSTREWLRDSRKMNRDQVAAALDAIAVAIQYAPEADGPYAVEMQCAREDAYLSESYPVGVEGTEERAARYAFELLFMGMAEADRHKVLEIEAMHAIHLLGDGSLEALLDLLKSLGAGCTPFTGSRVRDAECDPRLAALWANDVLLEAEELKEWADRRHGEPGEPIPF